VAFQRTSTSTVGSVMMSHVDCNSIKYEQFVHYLILSHS